MQPGVMVVSILLDSLKDQNIDVPEDEISYFFRCRIYFKMQLLNSKWKQPSQSQGTKNIKKIMQ